MVIDLFYFAESFSVQKGFINFCSLFILIVSLFFLSHTIIYNSIPYLSCISYMYSFFQLINDNDNEWCKTFELSGTLILIYFFLSLFKFVLNEMIIQYSEIIIDQYYDDD